MRTLPLILSFVLLLVAAAPASAADDAASLCSSPRLAVQTWIDHLQPDTERLNLARLCFDWSRGPEAASDRTQVARDLLSVLDGQGRYVSYAQIPASADWSDPDSGLGRYTLFPTLPEVYVDVGSDGLWRVSSATVASTPRLFKATYRIPLERVAQKLPPSFREPVAGVAAWKWLTLVLLILFAAVLGKIFEFVFINGLRKLIRKFFDSWNAEFERSLMRRLNLLVSAGIVAIMLPNLGLPVRLNLVLFVAVKLTASVAAVLIGMSLVDLIFDAWARVSQETETKMDDQLIPLLRRAADVLVWVVGGLFVLQNLDVDVGSLLAGLGLGGLAFALAAKDTISNIFGSLTIFGDRPFQIGDWVVVDGVEGTVERVGFRSTRVRTFYDSLVSIPNSVVANATVDNMGQRRARRFKILLSLTYDATPAQIEAFVGGVRASIVANPKMRDAAEVHWNNMSASSLDILVYCFFEVDTWTAELEGRQELMTEWFRLAKETGVEFAFPTQTLHLVQNPPTA
ncbi:MAG: mechanosensitive ion channel family protein [Proteobacteria bacterium]|nr:mechanosensitive ion channel family protein [Pseudomonadota bacterium]